MALYKIHFIPSIEKDLRPIPKKDRKKILKRIDNLAVNPRPPGCERLSGRDRFRIRQGDYRILYSIYDYDLIVWIVKVGHCKDIYR